MNKVILPSLIALTILTTFSFADAYAATPGEGSDASSPLVFTPLGDTTINFDALPQSTYLGTEIMIGDVTFSTPDETLVTSGTIVSTPPNLLSAHIAVNPPAPGGDFSGEMVMEFAENTCASDLEILMINPSFEATAFGIDGAELTTISSSGPNTELFSFAGFPVHKVVTTGTFYGIDDISFTEEFCAVVGGELLPIDTTALMLAGLQSSAIWMIPTLAGLAAAGFYLIKFRTNKE